MKKSKCNFEYRNFYIKRKIKTRRNEYPVHTECCNLFFIAGFKIAVYKNHNAACGKKEGTDTDKTHMSGNPAFDKKQHICNHFAVRFYKQKDTQTGSHRINGNINPPHNRNKPCKRNLSGNIQHKCNTQCKKSGCIHNTVDGKKFFL